MNHEHERSISGEQIIAETWLTRGTLGPGISVAEVFREILWIFCWEFPVSKLVYNYLFRGRFCNLLL